MATKQSNRKSGSMNIPAVIAADIDTETPPITMRDMAEYIRDLSRELADMAHASRLDLIAYHLTIVSREAAIAARGGIRDERIEI